MGGERRKEEVGEKEKDQRDYTQGMESVKKNYQKME